MTSQDSIDEFIGESVPDDEGYEVEYEWISKGRSLHKRERFALVSFSSSLEDMFDNSLPPTMLDGSSSTAVYSCTEERDGSDSDWEKVANQYGEVWTIHNQRP